jgi:hypothetical protein
MILLYQIVGHSRTHLDTQILEKEVGAAITRWIASIRKCRRGEVVTDSGIVELYRSIVAVSQEHCFQRTRHRRAWQTYRGSGWKPSWNCTHLHLPIHGLRSIAHAGRFVSIQYHHSLTVEPAINSRASGRAAAFSGDILMSIAISTRRKNMRLEPGLTPYTCLCN